jgi:hypothetical protein
LRICDRCVAYDIEEAADGLRRSGLDTASPIWYDIIEATLRTGRDHMSTFLRHVRQVAEAHGADTTYPVSNEIWRDASRLWLAKTADITHNGQLQK